MAALASKAPTQQPQQQEQDTKGQTESEAGGFGFGPSQEPPQVAQQTMQQQQAPQPAPQRLARPKQMRAALTERKRPRAAEELGSQPQPAAVGAAVSASPAMRQRQTRPQSARARAVGGVAADSMGDFPSQQPLDSVAAGVPSVSAVDRSHPPRATSEQRRPRTSASASDVGSDPLSAALLAAEAEAQMHAHAQAHAQAHAHVAEAPSMAGPPLPAHPRTAGRRRPGSASVYVPESAALNRPEWTFEPTQSHTPAPVAGPLPAADLNVGAALPPRSSPTRAKDQDRDSLVRASMPASPARMRDRETVRGVAVASSFDSAQYQQPHAQPQPHALSASGGKAKASGGVKRSPQKAPQSPQQQQQQQQLHALPLSMGIPSVARPPSRSRAHY